ncbi:hypothetical protein THAOC_11753, partial [Thalassiosira oceanica]
METMKITDKDGNPVDLSALGISDKEKKPLTPQHTSLLKRLSISEPSPIYSFGSWGLTPPALNGGIQPGFSTLPPGPEICGTYEIVYIAAVQNCSQVILRRQPNGASLIIDESTAKFAVGANGRLGSRGTTIVRDAVMIDGQVHLPNESGFAIDNYFGPGYKFFGFSSDSRASTSYTKNPANAGLIVTKKNDNKGRIFVVDEPKAFKLVHSETGIVANEVSDKSQEEETSHARQSCNPGTVWLDIRLTTPVNTYVLARRSDKVVFPLERLIGRIKAMIRDYIAQPDKTKFLQRVDEMMATPDAMQLTLEELEYFVGGYATTD